MTNDHVELVQQARWFAGNHHGPAADCKRCLVGRLADAVEQLQEEVDEVWGTGYARGYEDGLANGRARVADLEVGIAEHMSEKHGLGASEPDDHDERLWALLDSGEDERYGVYQTADAVYVVDRELGTPEEPVAVEEFIRDEHGNPDARLLALERVKQLNQNHDAEGQ